MHPQQEHIIYFNKFIVFPMTLIFGFFVLVTLGLALGAFSSRSEANIESYMWAGILGAGVLFMLFWLFLGFIYLSVRLFSSKPAIVLNIEGIEVMRPRWNCWSGKITKITWAEINNISSQRIKAFSHTKAIVLSTSTPKNKKNDLLIPSFCLKIRHKKLFQLCKDYHEYASLLTQQSKR